MDARTIVGSTGTSTNPSLPPTIPPSVSKQLVAIVGKGISSDSSSKRVPPDTAEAVSEALRIFVREAHRRASIEAECDDEGDFGETAVNEATAKTEYKTPIKAHHVTRIAGDLLMDFS